MKIELTVEPGAGRRLLDRFGRWLLPTRKAVVAMLVAAAAIAGTMVWIVSNSPA